MKKNVLKITVRSIVVLASAATVGGLTDRKSVV